MVAVEKLTCFADQFIAVYLWSLNHKQLLNLCSSILELRGCPKVILILFTDEKMAHSATGGRHTDIRPCLGVLAVSCIPGPTPISRFCQSVSCGRLFSSLSLLLRGKQWTGGFTVWLCKSKNVSICSWKRPDLKVVKTTGPWTKCRSTEQLCDSGKCGHSDAVL